MNLVNVYLARLNLLFNIEIQFIFINYSSEGLLNLFTSLHKLPFHHSIIYATVKLKLNKNWILFVYSLHLSIFYIKKCFLPITAKTLWRFYLTLFDIHYLTYMKNIFNSGLNISNELLTVLYLLVCSLNACHCSNASYSSLVTSPYNIIVLKVVILYDWLLNAWYLYRNLTG